MTEPSPTTPTALRWPFAIMAYLFVGLAMVGVVVPGLPTFPFLLLAAWAAARGSKRLHDWLYEHPRFGAALIDWEREKAVSRRSKILAVVLMAASWLIMLWRVGNPWVLAGLAALFAVTGSYVVRRPEPSSDDTPGRPGAA
jgi:uncharacterized membrane protein YbaN (DUF454 family)